MNFYARTILALASLTTFACTSPGSDGPGGGGAITGNSLQGRVIAQADAEGVEQEIAGVRVSAAGQVTTTDSYGFWTLPVPADTKRGVTIDYFRSGYAPYTYRYPVEITQSAFVQVSLMRVQIMQTITIGNGAVITSNLGEDQMQLAIILPPNFIDIDGDTVDVSVSIVRPDNEEEYKRFPGDFIGIDGNIPEGSDLLRTFGTVNVSFSQNGVPLDDVKLNAPAVMQMHLDARSAAEMAVGATIETWWLDTDTAEWMREDAASVVEINGEKYAEWEVSHFTWWNVDQPLSSHGCIAIEFSNIATLPTELLTHTMLELKGYDYAGWSQPQSVRRNGTAVLTGWRGHEVNIYIKYPGAPQSSLTLALTPLDTSEGNLTNGTFRVPSTFGSGFWNQGPNGIQLDPKQHCRNITREYTLKQGVVEGFVYGPDGKGVGGVVVYIAEIGLSTTTNPAGHYTFAHVPWSNDGSIRLTVAVRSTREYSARPELVTRNAAHQQANLRLHANEVVPSITDVHFSATEARPSSTIHFELTAEDNSASITWAAEVAAGIVELEQPHEVGSNGGLTYSSTIRGTWTGPTANALSRIQITATDQMGNPTQHLAYTNWRNRAPVLQFAGPTEIEINTTASYAIQTIDPDGDSLDIRWHVDGELQLDSGTSFAKAFSTAGAHAIRVEIYDGVNAVSRTIELTVVHVNYPPLVTLTGPSNVITNSPVTYMASASDDNDDALTLTWYINNVLQVETSSTLVRSFATENLYRVRVEVSDGIASTTREIAVVASEPITGSPSDVTPPETVLDSGFSGLTSSTTLSFNFSSPDTDTDHFECYLDSPPYSICSSPLDISGLTNTDYALVIRAVDAAGNADLSPLLVTWTVDTLAPSTSISNAPPLVTTSTTAEFDFSATDDSGIAAYYCSLDGAPEIPCVSPANYASLTTGIHSFSVYAIDQAGNVELLPNDVTWTITYGTWDMLAQGDFHTCAIHIGELFCWGDNTYGQLATYATTVTVATMPTRIGNLDTWSYVSAISATTCAIADGDIYCWGTDVTDNTNPAPHIMRPTGQGLIWSQVEVSYEHFCGISEGALYCWGFNYNGALGLGYPLGALVTDPLQVGSSALWSHIRLGWRFSCGINNGAAYCWGDDGNGQLGNGVIAGDQTEPTLVAGGSSWSAIDAGIYHACAIDSGSLYCWGANFSGQIGDGNLFVDQPLPSLVAGTGWTSIAAGGQHSCGINTLGTWCWGANYDGQLGDGHQSTERATPFLVSTSMTEISAGGLSTCSKDAAQWHCWGNHSRSQLGTQAYFGDLTTPSLIDNSGTWTTIATAQSHSCALASSGDLFCWGDNIYGQTGIGQSWPITRQPTQVTSPSAWSDVAAGYNHTCGISSGALWCWGSDSSGKLGNGAVSGNQFAPSAVSAGTQWQQVSTGQSHTCGIYAGGLHCWGNDGSGQIGNGAITSSQINPMRIETASDWSTVSAGGSHSCGIRIGLLYCWGSDGSGQIGNGATTGNQISPTLLTGSSWTSVAAGAAHTCAIQSGALYCWGSNGYGQIGNGSITADVPSPTLIDAGPGWTNISAMNSISCGIKNGALICWGSDINASQFASYSPVEFGPGPNWTSLAIAYYHSCAINNNNLYCWGTDIAGNGLLGTGLPDLPIFPIINP